MADLLAFTSLPAAGFLFTLDIVLLFHTGFIITCNLRKRLIMDGYFVARYYAKHASLLVDVLATVPAWIEVRPLGMLCNKPVLFCDQGHACSIVYMHALRMHNNCLSSCAMPLTELSPIVHLLFALLCCSLCSAVYAAAGCPNFALVRQ